MKLRSKAIGYWTATGLIAVVFLVSGVGNLARVTHIVHDMAHLGYPPYFHTILGTWKVLGAVAIVLPRMPRLKEWAYAGMIFDLTGAAFSRVASGDNLITVIVPVVIACLVIISFTLRPEEARLERFKK
jgi:uncharacterized membrane protein YphA (DoxX/SURF4 family)